MPMYDYECPKCEKLTELFTAYNNHKPQTCKHCGNPEAYRIVSFGKKSKNLDIFSPQRFEELGDDIPLISSKQELARECQKRGLVSRMLEDGYRSYKTKKEI